MIQLDKVTIGQFIDYCKLIDSLKPKLTEQFGNRDDINGMEIMMKCPEYVEEIVKFWTGWDTVKDKDMELVLGIFAAIEKLSVIPDTVAIPLFEHEGYTYHAPQDVQLLHRVVPMGKATFGQALEAMQIEQLMNGDYEMIPYVLAVIFTRDGETVDDIAVSERADIMRRLPITTAMNAYFFGTFREHLVKAYGPLFKSENDPKARRAGVEQLNKFGWYNLLWTAAVAGSNILTISKTEVLTVFQFLLRQREEAEFSKRLQKVYSEESKRK